MGTFWKSQKLISSKKKQSVLIAKISSRKTHKKALIRKNKLTQKFNFLPHGILYISLNFNTPRSKFNTKCKLFSGHVYVSKSQQISIRSHLR